MMIESEKNKLNALKQVLAGYLKAKINWQELISTQEEFLSSYKFAVCDTLIQISIKLDPLNQILIKFTARIGDKIENTEQILEYINKMNRKPQQQFFKYYILKKRKQIEAKLIPRIQQMSINGVQSEIKNISDFVSLSLIKFEDIIKDIHSLIYEKSESSDTAETKKSTKSNNYLIKLKNYIAQRIQMCKEKKTSQTSSYQNVCADVQNQKIMNQHIFVSGLKSKIKQMFEESAGTKLDSKVMRKIKILRLNEENQNDSWVPCAHACGSIQKLFASYEISNGSIHKLTNQIIKEDQAFIKCQGYLIQKKALDDVRSISSFETEAGILMHLRDKQSEFIGQYFAEQFNSTKISKLYSLYYPGQFSKIFFEDLKGSRKMKLISNLLVGLGFLSYYNILHRDIKPTNVVLDRKSNPRIIDFGSARPRMPLQVKYRLNYELRTTLKYNIIYDELPKEIKNDISKEKFQNHQTFDMYAFGKIMQELFMEIGFEMQIGKYYYESIQWLVQKCLQKNPQRRITPQQATIYMRLLVKNYLEFMK